MKQIVKACVFAIVVLTTFIQPIVGVGVFSTQHLVRSAHAQELPTWNSTTTYTPGMQVLHNASGWSASVTNTNSQPSPSNTNWEPLATEQQNVAGQANQVINQNEANALNEATARNFATDWECGLGIDKNSTLGGCFVQFAFWALYVPLQSLAFMAARFLDFFIFYSISSSSYTSSEFIIKGWEILRDLTNFAFIFALLYIAFQFVLNNSAKGKKLLINVILVGLTVNFSLFLTQVIVDGGNMLGNVFYNKITVTSNQGDLPLFNGSKQIAAAIVSESNPQRIISAETCKVQVIGSDGHPTGEVIDSACSLGTVLVQIFTAAAFAGALVYLFASMGFLFLGRTIGLMFQMIFSPIAFASKIVPGIPMKQLQFDTWLDETIKTSFLAPVYIFFIYLSIMFLKVGQSIGASYVVINDPIGAAISTLMPFAITLLLLIQGGKVAKQMAGTVAATVTSGLNMAGTVIGGVALGAATGGAGLAARASIGKAGAAVAAKTAGKTNMFARGLNRLGTTAASSTFDFRATRLGQLAQQKTGINMGTVSKNAAGGWTGMQERYIKEQEDKAKQFATIGANEKIARDKASAEERLRRAQKMDDPEYEMKVKEQNRLREERTRLEDELKKAKQANDPAEIRDVQDKLKTHKASEKTNNEELQQTAKYQENHEAQKALKDAEKRFDQESNKRKDAFAEKITGGIWNKVTNVGQVSQATRQQAIASIKGKPEKKEEYNQKPYQTRTQKAADTAFEQDEARLEKDIETNRNAGNKNRVAVLERQLAQLREQRELTKIDDHITRQQSTITDLQTKIAAAQIANDQKKVKDLTKQYNAMTALVMENKVKKIDIEQQRRKEQLKKPLPRNRWEQIKKDQIDAEKQKQIMLKNIKIIKNSQKKP